MNSFFGTEFWQNLVTTILGAIIGILIALWLDRLIQKKHREERKSQILQSLLSTLRQNMEILNQDLKVLMEGGNIVYYETFNVNLLLLNAATPVAFEYITDVKFLDKISKVQYHLEHLHLKIKTIFEVHSQGQKSNVKSMLSEITSHVERTAGLVKEALGDIEGMLPKELSAPLP